MKTFSDPEAFARVKRLPLYVFTITDKLRDDAIARGVDVVDFSMGNPDGATPPRIVEALKRAVDDRRMHRYLNPRGLPELGRRRPAGGSGATAWRWTPSARCSSPSAPRRGSATPWWDGQHL